MRPNRTFAFLSLIVLLVLQGCGTSATKAPVYENSPEGVVKRLLLAVEKQDSNQYLDALDPALRDQPGYFFANALFKGIQSYLGLEGAGDLTEVAFRDLQFETTGNSGTSALVSTTGKIRYVTLGTESDFSGVFFVVRISGTWYVSDQSTQVTPTPPGPALVLIPVETKIEPSGGGWAWWTMRLAIENQGGSLYQGDWPSKGQLRVSEGFAYDAWVSFEGPENWYPGTDHTDLILPPKFRIKGFGTFEMVVYAQIGEQTHPQTLLLDGFGELSAESVLPEPHYPTDLPTSDFYSVPDTIEIPGSAKIVIEGFSVTPGRYGDTDTPGLLVGVTFQNLNIGQGQRIDDIEITVLGEQGYEDSARYLSLEAGPGQTVSSQMSVPLWWASTDGPHAFGLPTTGLKLVLQLKDQGIVRIYNTGY